MRYPLRSAIMLGAAASLIAALLAGLARLGWSMPVVEPWAILHGPVMVAGFFGTVIGLERAVALGRRWGYAAPVFSAVGTGVLMVAGIRGDAPLLLGAPLVLLGSVVMLGAYLRVFFRQASGYLFVMTLGAVAWAAGNAFWLWGRPLPEVIYWWMAFLVLTIVGERLELNRVMPPRRGATGAFYLSTLLYVLGVVMAPFEMQWGTLLIGVGLMMLAAWLLRFDAARRTRHTPGLTRFIALTLLGGYAWLGVGGALLLWLGPESAGFGYDAVLHSVFVGFVFAMIFGHVPIVLPAVLGVAVRFTRFFYLHVVLLHASLFVRLAADLLGDWELRKWAGLVNVIALVVFALNTVVAVKRGRPTARRALGDVPSAK